MPRFCPMRMTLSSRCISSAMAAAIAWMYIISCGMTRSLLRENVLRRLFRCRQWAREREIYRSVHFVARLAFDFLGRSIGKHLAFDKKRAESRNGIAGLRGVVLIGVAINLDRLVFSEFQGHRRRDDVVSMRAEAIHLRFDQARAISGTRAID